MSRHFVAQLIQLVHALQLVQRVVVQLAHLVQLFHSTHFSFIKTFKAKIKKYQSFSQIF